MRVLASLVTSLALPLVLAAQGAQVVDHVTVIDVTTGTARPDQRVVISGSRMTAVGPAGSTSAPASATIIDGRGKFLIPGMWDMHVHIVPGSTQQNGLLLFLANGITGVRDMAGSVDALLQWRQSTADGSVVGPRMLGAGVLVDGAPHVYPLLITHEITTPAQARQAVDSLVSRGVNFIKAYEMLRADVFDALAAQAKARGIPIVGHLPLSVRAEDAVRSGLRSFEHLRNLEIACSTKADSLRAVAVAMLDAGKDQPGMQLRASIHSALRPRAYETYDEARCGALIDLMKANGTWQDPNLVLSTQGTFRHDTTERMQKWVRFLQPPLSQSFARDAGSAQTQRGGRGGPASPDMIRRTEWALRLVKRMHDAGIPLLPGTDYPNPVMVPGASLHEELALFVRAGLTPAEALRTATLNPARFFGMTDSLGTIASGQLAELVLLDANPLVDIRNVAQVRGVWRAGRYFDRDRLDALLEEQAKRGPGGH